MTIVLMMQMALDEIVHTVAVRDLIMAASWSMPMGGLMRGAPMTVRAGIGIHRADIHVLPIAGVHRRSPFVVS
jgi:hypothetical protein